MWMDLDSGIRIVNVYAPGDFHSQKEFFAELDNHLVGPSRVALVGDFNCVLGPIDRRTFRGTPPKWSDRRSKGVLRELVDDLGLIDAWRALRSAQSGMNSTGRNARSRIDRFYVSPSLAPSTHSSWLVSSALSDHSLLILRLAGTDIAAQGKRPWRLNARLLNDREILVDVARLIQRKVHVTPELDGDRWDEVKADVAECFRSWGKRPAREERAEMRNISGVILLLSRPESTDPGIASCYACESTANVHASEKGNLCQGQPASPPDANNSTASTRGGAFLARTCSESLEQPVEPATGAFLSGGSDAMPGDVTRPWVQPPAAQPLQIR
ncbi:hypothetical protein HPB51_004723 [Rhipicephalus microplus]|uniref:Endonuclease/exonuclease/phosphatase domain-containing protein n=1 Tax=Rhipicephalus microplus TaxID=6941 RepID=A0A9J6DYS6_RHIMP|nr:hypothetical protein HPB51_004723 [Rhipicephalus microplus]